LGAFNNLIKAMNAGDISGISQEGVHVYPLSFTVYAHVKLVMVKENRSKFLLAAGEGPLLDELQGETADGYKICGLTHENRLVLNKYFPYTAPTAFGTKVATLGLGDRLGLASPGHIKTVIGRDIKPILAQQSIRELTLTGRDYKQVVDAACYAVFQEGYKGGFGADGDHLKKEEDIRMSIDLGFTMLTLDCSENIDNSIEGLTSDEVESRYGSLPAETRRHFEGLYLNQQFDVGGHAVYFDKIGLMKTVLIYHEAINFMVHIYKTYIKNAGRTVDFEISIDETLTSTDPAAHYLIAAELYARGVDIFSMAPRFCGEFQKGIDYMGDIVQFERELAVHAAIADHFGYKLSIHSGSDKFSVFPIIAKYTKGRFHAKTAGTNWLEAVRTVARVHPALYRDMHTYALAHVEEALAYYHVSADFTKIKPLDQVSDADLPTYMNEDNARQLIHITYGLLLQAKDGSGKPLFKEQFFKALIDQEEEYEQSLIKHIGRHLELLGK
jgi:hypothetical protein